MSVAVELRGICKAYGALTANRAVDLTVDVGTVHAIVGENGAGKSTLMRILAGVEVADAGTVRILGESPARPTAREAIRLGLGMVHQHFMLVEPFTVAENLVLGHELLRAGLLDLAAARKAVADVSAAWGLEVPADARVEDLSVGEKQRVEILRVLYQGARVLVLDEPTAVLSPAEVTRLLAMLRRFAASGRTVLIVTHKLDEVMAVADRVTVLRRGERVGDLVTMQTSPAELAHLMVGRPVPMPGNRPDPPDADPAIDESIAGSASGGSGASAGARPAILTLDGLGLVAGGRSALAGVSFKVGAGEIVGIAGVIGNGQSELLDVLGGLRAGATGTVQFGGSDRVNLLTLSVAERIRAGVAHVPEDRADRGLVADFTVAENLMLGKLREFGPWYALGRTAVRAHADAVLERFDVRPRDPEAQASTLSGGNAQKVVLGREITRSPRLLLCGQPTRGVDIGAVEAIHAQLRALRDAGVGIVLVSAELTELLALCDRILVMHRGRITGEFLAGEADLDRIGELMLGATAAPAAAGIGGPP